MKFNTANDLMKELLQLQLDTLGLVEQIENNPEMYSDSDCNKAMIVCEWNDLRSRFFTLNEFFNVTQSAGALIFNVAQHIDAIGEKQGLSPFTIINQLEVKTPAPPIT